MVTRRSARFPGVSNRSWTVSRLRVAAGVHAEELQLLSVEPEPEVASHSTR